MPSVITDKAGWLLPGVLRKIDIRYSPTTATRGHGWLQGVPDLETIGIRSSVLVEQECTHSSAASSAATGPTRGTARSPVLGDTTSGPLTCALVILAGPRRTAGTWPFVSEKAWRQAAHEHESLPGRVRNIRAHVAVGGSHLTVSAVKGGPVDLGRPSLRIREHGDERLPVTSTT